MAQSKAVCCEKCGHEMTTPDNTAEIDALVRDAKQGRDFIELVREHLTIETPPEIVQAINAIDAAMKESKT